MANFITGREIILAIGKAVTWRTAVDVNAASKGVLVRSESLFNKSPNYVDDDSMGLPDLVETVKVSEVNNGSMEANLRFNGLDLLFALALGETASGPTQLSGTAYQTTFQPADGLTGIFATACMKKSDTSHGYWEIPSMKVTGFTVTGGIGELSRVTFDVMGNKTETQSPTNSDLSSVTYPDKSNLARLDSRFKMRMNAASGAALLDSDIVYPSSFELAYRRPHEENYEAGNIDMSEPVQSGFAECSLRITLDKYNTDTFLDALEAETNQKIDILFEGEVITGAYRYQMRFDIPKILFQVADAPATGPGTIPHNIEGRCLSPTTAPSGMTGVTDPISLTLVNLTTTDPLA